MVLLAAQKSCVKKSVKSMDPLAPLVWCATLTMDCFLISKKLMESEVSMWMEKKCSVIKHYNPIKKSL